MERAEMTCTWNACKLLVREERRKINLFRNEQNKFVVEENP
jgi:hypothetical protein